MDLIDQLETLASRIKKQREHITTEEATKTAFILPFINALGYDVFNPLEVVPEYTTDVGIKKGEKIDYAIMRDGKPIILFECKKCGVNLDEVHMSQLYRYFHTSEARIAILSNGITYRFHTDLVTPNKMDDKPFMELDILDINEPIVAEIKKLSKSSFDIERAVNAAGELKYTKEIKEILSAELDEPTDDFVKFFAARVYNGRITQSVKDQFAGVVKKALSQFLNEKINARLQSAMSKTDDRKVVDEVVVDKEKQEEESRIETTQDEIEGFHMVKAILSSVIDPNRITHRDTVSYFGILLDDNNRKPLCRLHFNRTQKYIGLINQDKKEERIPIDNLTEIYTLAERLKDTIKVYESE